MASPKLLKGALVQLVEMPIVPAPNIIVFQYNPETITRTLAPFAREASAERTIKVDGKYATYAEPSDPREELGVTLVLDATDDLEQEKKVAMLTGIADRMAALEMLLYPQSNGLGGALRIPLAVSVKAPETMSDEEEKQLAHLKQAKKPKLPVVLFVWGPGRIVPVRLKQLQIEEQQWNQLLYPTRAKVTVSMQVLAGDSLALDLMEGTSDTRGVDIAQACYDMTIAQKQILALANLLHTGSSLTGAARSILDFAPLPIP